MNRLILACMLWLAAGSLFSQNSVPPWYPDKESQYPSSRFITGVGEGAVRSEAEKAAVSAISLFFNTRIEVRNEMIREFNEGVSNNSTDFSKNIYITEKALVRSETELLGIHFAVPYLDAKRQIWSVLAYIDRAEAAALYDSKINGNMAVINALAEDAKRETESIYSCTLLYRGLRLAGLTEELIKIAVMVDSGSSGKYTAYLKTIQNIRSNYRVKRDELSFTVKVNHADFVGRIERKLGELLEDFGCTVTSVNPRYTVSVRLTITEENQESGVFLRPGIAVQVERNSKTFFSYNKNYQRYGHRTMDGAYNRVFLAIEQDLEQNCMPKLTAMIGR